LRRDHSSCRGHNTTVGTGRHIPGWFARLADGAGAVIDRRPDGPTKPADQAAFEATAHACRLVGWQ
jgi:hypothetical protein